MAYTPINWQTGDTITAEKLNRCDNGWGVESTQLFSETVTTVDQGDGVSNFAELSYSGTSAPSSMTVTFDSVSYDCPQQDYGGVYVYGAPNRGDFSSFPFSIVFMNGEWKIYTQTAGTYALSASGSAVVVSPAFQSAVSLCADTSMMPMLCVSGTTTRMDMGDAAYGGRLLYFYYESDYVQKSSIIVDMYSSPMGLIGQDASVTADFDNDDIFTVTVS